MEHFSVYQNQFVATNVYYELELMNKYIIDLICLNIDKDTNVLWHYTTIILQQYGVSLIENNHTIKTSP